MGLFTLLIKSSDTYQKLYQSYERVKSDKDRILERNYELLEELKDPHAKEKALELQFGNYKQTMEGIITQKDALIRQQTEADILWAAKQIEKGHEQKVKSPQVVLDPRLGSYAFHSTSSLSPAYSMQSIGRAAVNGLGELYR